MSDRPAAVCQSLNPEHWTVRAVDPGPDAPDQVRNAVFRSSLPGCVHLDLIRAGVIEHPNHRFAERNMRWVGRTGWILAAEFAADERVFAHERTELVLREVDGIADVRLNGRRLGRTASSFLTHRFDLTNQLTKRRNRLELHFEPTLTYIHRQLDLLGARPYNGDEQGWDPFPCLRAPACMFGWDWHPRVPTSGLVEAAIESWSCARLRAVRPRTDQQPDGSWICHIDIELEYTRPCPLHIAAVLRDSERDIALESTDLHPDAHTAQLQLRAHNVKPWFPRGCGEQKLYDLHLWIRCQDGTTLDDWIGRIGFRTVRLDQTGGAHTFVINECPIFCKGSNWVPTRVFRAEASPETVRRQVEQAARAHMNMLRVWGGGRYEQDEFYHACDELGIMVWQDFMLACAMYPEQGELPGLITREAHEQISRLCAHPSVVLWCGGNENVWARQAWGWSERLGEQSWGEQYITHTFAHACAQLDPTRPYRINSPSSGPGAGSIHADANSAEQGDRHTWDRQFDGYRELITRFTSELGHQAPPVWRTLADAIGPEQMRVGSEAMEFRQRATAGNAPIFTRAMESVFGREPQDFDEWLYAAHVLQARALALAGEWHRLHWPRCAGLLTWQLNDCWAGPTWSIIDADGRLKPAYYALRRAFAPQLCALHPIDGVLRLALVNDTPDAFEGTITLRRMDFQGRPLAEQALPITVEPRSSIIASDAIDLVGEPDDQSSELLIAEGFGLRSVWFWRPDKDLAYPKPICRGKVQPADGGYHLHLHAQTLIRELMIDASRLAPDAESDDQLLTMLPGERRTVLVRTDASLNEHDLLRPPVLRCAGA